MNAPKENQWFWNKLDTYLDKHQLKQTRQRRSIVEVFLKENRHLDAEKLHAILSKKGMKIGLATVYRTLNLLVEAGVADQRSFADGRAVFEVLHPDQHHDHIICLECGAVIEFENDEIEKLQENVARAYDFKLRSHRLDLFGQCTRNPCDRRKS